MMQRTAISLLILATVAAAQDAAADLFYRGFWLEQAQGRAADAEALYRRVLAEHPRAPEAPRALLGLVRIRAAAGRDVDDLLARLGREYPDAGTELEQARRVAAAFAREFDPGARPEDPPAVAKLKQVYLRLTTTDKGLEPPEQNFLVDLGAAAHPMLRELLRAHDPGDVALAAKVLLDQRTDEAKGLLAAALRDRRVLFRDVIVQALQHQPLGAGESGGVAIAEALGTLFGQASARLKGDIATTVGRQCTFGGASRAMYDVLAQALTDPDDAIRDRALGTWTSAEFEAVPDAVVRALVDVLRAGSRRVRYYGIPWLPRWAHREGLFEPIRDALVAYPEPAVAASGPDHDAGVRVVEEAAVRRLAKEPDDKFGLAMVHHAAAWSGDAAARLADHALEHGLGKSFTSTVLSGALRTAKTPDALASYLGDATAALRRKAIGLLFSDEAGRREAAAAFLRYLHPTPAELDALVAGLERHLGADVPSFALTRSFVAAIGPEGAARLVPFCDPRELETLFEAHGFDLAEGRPFFAAWIAAAGPEHVRRLAKLAELEGVAPLVVRRLLAAKGEEWGWNDVEGNWPGSRWPGPWLLVRKEVRAACWEPPLRAELAAYTTDPREWIARTATDAVAGLETEAATEALVRALDSPFEEVRSTAVIALARRGDAGVPAIRSFARRDPLTDKDRSSVRSAIGRMPEEPAVALCEELLETRTDAWDSIWHTYAVIGHERAIERALVEATGSGGEQFRLGALRVLRDSEDARRLEVFRRILEQGADDAAVAKVLETVGDQYLVELGNETLRHLRNPDAHVRGLARQAVEGLKFYAEARKAFDAAGAGK